MKISWYNEDRLLGCRWPLVLEHTGAIKRRLKEHKPKVIPEMAEPAQKNKTSLVFATKNIPGALYACLGAFAKRNINLAKLESRPGKIKPWEYVFYVDFEGHITDVSCQEALAELEPKTNFLKILGSYACAAD